MRTGSPMSSRKTSPPVASAPACSTSCAASGIVMKKRVTSGCVTVTGPPRSICSRNSGTTEPDDPSTLPKRTIEKRVPSDSPAVPAVSVGEAFAGAPSRWSVRTALSVEIRMKFDTPASSAASAAYNVPNVLFFRPWMTLRSTRLDVLVRGRVDTESICSSRTSAAAARHRSPTRAPQSSARRASRFAMIWLQFAVDLVQAVFVLVEQHEQPRPAEHNLPAQLRPDRSAGARHQHRVRVARTSTADAATARPCRGRAGPRCDIACVRDRLAGNEVARDRESGARGPRTVPETR